MNEAFICFLCKKTFLSDPSGHECCVGGHWTPQTSLDRPVGDYPVRCCHRYQTELKETDRPLHSDFEDGQPAAWVSYTIHYTTSMAPSQLKGISYDNGGTSENTAKASPDDLLEYAPQGIDFANLKFKNITSEVHE